METRFSRWRKANPEKHKAQQERKRLRRKGLMEKYEKPQKLSPEEAHARHIARCKELRLARKERAKTDPEYAAMLLEKERQKHRRRYDRLKADPEAYQAKLESERIRKRIARGIPLDQAVTPHRLSETQREQREQRKAEHKRQVAERAAAREAARLAAREAKQREKEAEAKRKELERIKQRNIQRALIESQKAARAEEKRLELLNNPPAPRPVYRPKRGRILALCGWNGF